jgi:hypothetical protein
MRRIDDHSSWLGSGKEIPMGAKQKEFAQASSVGHLSDYMDTEDKIKGVQDAQAAKAKGQGMKQGFRY